MNDKLDCDSNPNSAAKAGHYALPGPAIPIVGPMSEWMLAAALIGGMIVAVAWAGAGCSVAPPPPRLTNSAQASLAPKVEDDCEFTLEVSESADARLGFRSWV